MSSKGKLKGNQLFEVKDDFIGLVVIQTFRMTHFNLILTVFSGAYDAMV